MCARFDTSQNLIKSVTNNSHTTLDDIQNKIGPKVIKNLKTFRSCGNVGDGTMNPECAEIYRYVRRLNKETFVSINTNGGARNPDFFRQLADIGVTVVFSIDGLEDTNHLYRRNVQWKKLMENVKAFIKSGGRATWDYLIFKHNQHQVDDAQKMASELGFIGFNKKTTARWDDFDKEGNWMQRDSIEVDGYKLEKPKQEILHDKQLVNFLKEQSKEKKVACRSFLDSNVEIFLHANGDVSPCCWLGDLHLHESKNIIDDYGTVNIHHSSLEEILESKYFMEIWKGIQGKEQAYRLQTCQQVCGIND